MHLPIGFLARFRQRLDEVLPVHVIQENLLPPVTTAHDVIHRPRILDAQLARHADIQDCAPSPVNAQNDPSYGLTPLLIERLYPRAEFPEVYLSLRAIHHAQMRSLDQQDGARTWDERALLALSIAKGGASVLTDACLVRGSLTEDKAEFMFAYGVVLQLMDDLQDIRDDLANRHLTIFTRQTGLARSMKSPPDYGLSRERCSGVSAGSRPPNPPPSDP